MLCLLMFLFTSQSSVNTINESYDNIDNYELTVDTEHKIKDFYNFNLSFIQW